MAVMWPKQVMTSADEVRPEEGEGIIERFVQARKDSDPTVAVVFIPKNIPDEQ